MANRAARLATIMRRGDVEETAVALEEFAAVLNQTALVMQTTVNAMGLICRTSATRAPCLQPALHPPRPHDSWAP